MQKKLSNRFFWIMKATILDTQGVKNSKSLKKNRFVSNSLTVNFLHSYANNKVV